jgi:hypothetical protein
VAAVLGVVGGVAILNTTDGQAQGSGSPEDRFPDTLTAMIAVTDDAGNLGSLAVVALRPGDGEGDEPAGGTVVVVPVSADGSGGFGTERTPLNETVAMFGAATLAEEVPALLGLSIDTPAVLGAAELAELLAPVGPVMVELPTAVTGADGQEIAPAGEQRLDPAAAAAVLAAADPETSADDRYAATTAVWRAIAAAVGDGLDQTSLTEPAGSDQPAGTEPDAVSSGIEGIVGQLATGPIGVSTVGFERVVDLALNPRGVDVVALDRAEVVTLFAHVAPNKMAAPNPGYSFLIRSAYPGGQLPDGLSRYDVAYAATSALLGEPVLGNVLSVDSTEGDDEVAAPAIVEVSDESLVALAEDLDAVLGPVDVRVAERPVAGIDVIVELGTDFLDVVAAGSSPVGPAPGVTSSPTGTGPATSETEASS